MGIYVHYDANGGTNEPTDSLLYKESATVVAQTAATPADTAKDQFLYWVMQKWDSTANNGAGAFVDVDNTPIYPGQNFILEEQYAQKVEERDDEGNLVTDEHGRQQYIYTVQLRAEYGPLNVALDTHVIWYGNGGTLTGEPSTALTDEYVYSDRTAVNTPIPIKPNLFTHPEGYIFLGWARLDEDAVVVFKTGADGKPTTEIDHFNPQTQLTEDNVWLEYAIKDEQHDNNYFKVNDSTNSTIDGKTVTHIGADDKTPYHVMVAVWSSSQYYYVFHSSTCEIEARPLEKNSTVDLTSLVKPGYLYGGYYKDYSKLNATPETSSVVFDASVQAVYNKSSYTAIVQGATAYDGSSLKVNDKRFWDKADAYTSANNADVGTALQPKGSEVYFLKEVPETYLMPKYQYVYDLDQDKTIIHLYLISIVDDSYYRQIGYSLVDGKNVNAAKEADITVNDVITTAFTIVQKASSLPTDDDNYHGEIKIKTTADNFGLARGYLVVKDLSSYLDNGNGNEYTFTYMPSWETLDGVKVNSRGPIACTISADKKSITYETLGEVYSSKQIYINMAGGPKHDGSETSYWDTDGAVHKIYAFNDSGLKELIDVTKVDGEDTIYTATIPAGRYTKMILLRLNPNKEVTVDNLWTTEEAVWNKTDNIDIPRTSANYITFFYAGSSYVGWSTYAP